MCELALRLGIHLACHSSYLASSSYAHLRWCLFPLSKMISRRTLAQRQSVEILAYENDEADRLVPMLFAYAKLAGLPVENLLDDDRDLWVGHGEFEKFFKVQASVI